VVRKMVVYTYKRPLSRRQTIARHNVHWHAGSPLEACVSGKSDAVKPSNPRTV